MLRSADPGTPVATCPDWALRDLALHLGEVHGWAGAIVRTGERQPLPTVQVDDDRLADWYADTAQRLLTDLQVAPATPVWTLTGPGEAAFWRRRQALETAVHRVDAERAAGVERPVPAELAADGIAEVLDVMHPRQVARGRCPEPTCAALLVSPDGEWLLGSGAVCATVTGSASELLLLLWKRLAPSDLRVTGDVAALGELLGQPVTP